MFKKEGMFKKVLILFSFIFIGALVFVYYNLATVKKIETSNDKKVEINENLEKVNDQTKEDDEEKLLAEDKFKNISFGELINLGQALKCSWGIEKEEISQDADAENIDEDFSGGKERGEIYILAGNFLQKKEIQENSQKITVNVLKKDGWIYQWSSMSKQGTRMTPSKAQSMEVLDLDRRLDFSCEENSVLDDNILNPPSDIEFIQF